MRSCVSGRSFGVSRRNMLMMAPIWGSTLITKTFSSFPTNRAHPLFAGRIPRIWTGSTSFFMNTVYCAKWKKQARDKSEMRFCRAGKTPIVGGGKYHRFYFGETVEDNLLFLDSPTGR